MSDNFSINRTADLVQFSLIARLLITITVQFDCSQPLGIKAIRWAIHLMTISELSLRLARPADATTIANLSRDLIEYGLRWRWTPMRVAASIRAPDVNVLVACVHDNIAGFAIMRYGDDDAHLDLLAVAPRYRRAGIGRQLLEWLEKCAVVAGIFTRRPGSARGERRSPALL